MRFFLSYIYIITNGTYFKIGFSKNPERRVKQLQTGNSDKLSLLYSVKIDIAPIKVIETIVHRQFPHKISGEWYSGNFEEIKQTIDYIKIRYDNEDTDIQYQNGLLNYFY